MDHSCIELNVLPDEILLIIFEKLDNINVLYSFHGANKRLNKIIRDAIFTSSLNFVKWSSNKFINKLSSNVMLNQFCLQILPDISINIKWFYLESSSVKRILNAADYPNLYGLGLYNMKEKTARRLFTDQSLSSGIFKKQITKLMIAINEKTNNWFTMIKVCSRIFPVFSNLTHLMFHESSYKDIVPLCFDVPSRSFSSSSLSVLNIKVQSFSECLYILDGRFNQLHTLIVDLVNFGLSEELMNQTRKIPNLKCFVLSSLWETLRYERLVLPLLYRMSNLEKLGLYLPIYLNNTLIDGNHFKKHILNHMSQLNEFSFHVCSCMYIRNQEDIPTNEDIQQTFKDFQCPKITSYVDYFPKEDLIQCHVYSYPYKMPYYQNITNSFPGGLYQYVRIVSLHDEYPFEHEFFIKISQSFPCMQQLSLINHQSQKYKQSHNLSIVKYNHLTELDLEKVHDDYIEEYLFNTKTYFHNNINLDIQYQSLERVTNNFTRDSTRINCAKISQIHLSGKKNYSNSLRDYFPNATIR